VAIPTVFADFLLSADSSYINDPNKVAEAVSNRSFMWRRLLSGKTPKEYLQGGKSIQTFLQLDDQGSAHFYGIGDEESPTQPQTVTALESPWRFMRASYTYDDETVKLNTAGLGRTARHKQYFKFKQQLEGAMWIDMYKLMEAQLWAVPDGSEMESTTSGSQPQSIPVFVNEDTNGHPAGYTSDSVTTIQSVSRASKAQFRPQQVTYGSAGASGSDLTSRMSRTFRQVKFDGLPEKEHYGSKSTMPVCVATMLDGLMAFEDTMRAQQDLFVYVGRQDPAYPKPTIHGIPVEYVSELDTAAIFPTGTSEAYSTYDDPTTTVNFFGPRFFFLNLDDMCPIFHSEMYMEKHPALTPYRQPSRHTVYVDTYYNLFLKNSRTQGILYPDADITNYDNPPTTS
jgi:hypothetical protein